MTKPALAAQLYTVRAFTQTRKDLAATLHKVRQIGYTAAQFSAVGPVDPKEIEAMLAAEGLTMCNTHVGWERLQKDLPAVIAEHRLWGCRHVALGSMPEPYRQAGEEGFRRFAREANGVGRALHEAGLTFSYHNHSFEFVRFGRRTGLDVIYEETDARHLQAEIDTYWVQHGGGDPVAWVRRMKDRMPVVHLKDMVILDGAQAMAEIGEGNLNWPAILEACREAGVEWYAVEQDTCQRDPFESLAISYRYLNAAGLQ